MADVCGDAVIVTGNGVVGATVNPPAAFGELLPVSGGATTPPLTVSRLATRLWCPTLAAVEYVILNVTVTDCPAVNENDVGVPHAPSGPLNTPVSV
jgi:hypothetical protein